MWRFTVKLLGKKVLTERAGYVGTTAATGYEGLHRKPVVIASEQGKSVSDEQRMLDSLSPAMRRRLMALLHIRSLGGSRRPRSRSGKSRVPKGRTAGTLTHTPVSQASSTSPPAVLMPSPSPLTGRSLSRRNARKLVRRRGRGKRRKEMSQQMPLGVPPSESPTVASSTVEPGSSPLPLVTSPTESSPLPSPPPQSTVETAGSSAAPSVSVARVPLPDAKPGRVKPLEDVAAVDPPPPLSYQLATAVSTVVVPIAASDHLEKMRHVVTRASLERSGAPSPSAQSQQVEEYYIASRGPLFATAVIAGTNAVKSCSTILPMSSLTSMQKCSFTFRRRTVPASAPFHVSMPHRVVLRRRTTPPPASIPERQEYSILYCFCTVASNERGRKQEGVEMEALTGATVAAATMYDMLRHLPCAQEDGLRLGESFVLAKRGGQQDFVKLLMSEPPPHPSLRSLLPSTAASSSLPSSADGVRFKASAPPRVALLPHKSSPSAPQHIANDDGKRAQACLNETLSVSDSPRADEAPISPAHTLHNHPRYRMTNATGPALSTVSSHGPPFVGKAAITAAHLEENNSMPPFHPSVNQQPARSTQDSKGSAVALSTTTGTNIIPQALCGGRRKRKLRRKKVLRLIREAVKVDSSLPTLSTSTRGKAEETVEKAGIGRAVEQNMNEWQNDVESQSESPSPTTQYATEELSEEDLENWRPPKSEKEVETKGFVRRNERVDDPKDSQEMESEPSEELEDDLENWRPPKSEKRMKNRKADEEEEDSRNTRRYSRQEEDEDREKNWKNTKQEKKIRNRKCLGEEGEDDELESEMSHRGGSRKPKLSIKHHIQREELEDDLENWRPPKSEKRMKNRKADEEEEDSRNTRRYSRQEEDEDREKNWKNTKQEKKIRNRKYLGEEGEDDELESEMGSKKPKSKAKHHAQSEDDEDSIDNHVARRSSKRKSLQRDDEEVYMPVNHSEWDSMTTRIEDEDDESSYNSSPTPKTRGVKRKAYR